MTAEEQEIFDLKNLVTTLQGQVAEHQERVRVVDHMNGLLQAQIQYMRSQIADAPKEKETWFGYKSADGNTLGAIDMLMISGWRANLVARQGWQTIVYAGNFGHVLNDAMTKDFWVQFAKYLERS